ncbi:MAG: hypothetical protein ABJE47_21300 [bacterium]
MELSEDNGRAAAAAEARSQFKRALMEMHTAHLSVDRVESAAAQFCECLRDAGLAPEQVVVEAKGVIEETIDGDHALAAERLVRTCIEHYYSGR